MAKRLKEFNSPSYSSSLYKEDDDSILVQIESSGSVIFDLKEVSELDHLIDVLTSAKYYCRTNYDHVGEKFVYPSPLQKDSLIRYLGRHPTQHYPELGVGRIYVVNADGNVINESGHPIKIIDYKFEIVQE